MLWPRIDEGRIERRAPTEELKRATERTRGPWGLAGAVVEEATVAVVAEHIEHAATWSRSVGWSTLYKKGKKEEREDHAAAGDDKEDFGVAGDVEWSLRLG